MAKMIDLTLDGGEVIKISVLWDKFARNMALTGNASQSRTDAGYKKHPNPQINATNAWLLLQKVNVQKAYDYHRARVSEKMDISENRILAEMAAVGFSNVAKMFSNGALISVEKMDTPTQRAIKSVKVSRHFEGPKGEEEQVEVIAIEMHPKMVALKQIAEIKKMTETDSNRAIAVTVNIDGRQVTEKQTASKDE